MKEIRLLKSFKSPINDINPLKALVLLNSPSLNNETIKMPVVQRDILVPARNARINNIIELQFLAVTVSLCYLDYPYSKHVVNCISCALLLYSSIVDPRVVVGEKRGEKVEFQIMYRNTYNTEWRLVTCIYIAVNLHLFHPSSYTIITLLV
jgi:hypothetical protein